jgi:hypothetical protein
MLLSRRLSIFITPVPLIPEADAAVNFQRFKEGEHQGSADDPETPEKSAPVLFFCTTDKSGLILFHKDLLVTSFSIQTHPKKGADHGKFNAYDDVGDVRAPFPAAARTQARGGEVQASLAIP